MKARESSTVTELKRAQGDDDRRAAQAVPRIATVRDVPERGALIVECEDGRPRRARVAAPIAALKPDALVGREVLVICEGDDPERPVAVALLHSPFADEPRPAEPTGDEVEARVDGEHVVIEAGRKLELRCGKASIVIDANGKITIRGAHLLNRSTGPIRIKGGHVDIN